MYFIELMVNADNAIDYAHRERAPLPFLSCMIEDCIGRGKAVQQGGAVYQFTGPQGFGVANVADSLYAVRKLVYDDRKLTLKEYKEALNANFGQGSSENTIRELTKRAIEELKKQGHSVDKTMVDTLVKQLAKSYTGASTSSYQQLLDWIAEVPKYGNDIDEIDYFAREVAQLYTKEVELYRNIRGGRFQAGLYPVSANVPLGAQTGATPDGRLAGTPIADGVSPGAGRDTNGPTASANSVSKLDHFNASNGTLFNQKFHPSALEGEEGIRKFISLIQVFFEKKGSHVQFNVVSRETLLNAQKHPEQYADLVVRVAGYSALFTTLSRALQDDIIQRTEQSY